MEIFNDLPIENKEHDILGRAKFASKIVNIISMYTEVHKNDGAGLVIGLQGPWGCGKTSVVNLICNELNENDKLVISKFNSWLTSDKTSLIVEFFNIFIEKLNESEEDLSASVNHTSDQILFKMKKYASNILRSTTIDTKFGVKFDLKKIFSDQSMTYQKNEVDKLMNSNDKFNIFFIDDIDRLSEAEIAMLFQLIKNIADFHKVIYVLCYDVDIVASALDVVHKNRGREYIEKIVQYPIDLPKINKKHLKGYFIYMLDNVVSSDLKDETDYKNNDFYELYELGIGKYINSIRDCNRIINAFSMRYYSLRHNVYISDLLALTVLSLYERSVYVYISKHTNIFMGISDGGILPLKQEDAEDVLKNKIYKYVLDEFHSNVKHIICKLFPEFSRSIGKSSYSKEYSYKNYRVCFDDFFDRYFEFDLDESDTSHYEAEKLIKDMNENDAKKFIEQKYKVYGLQKLVGQIGVILFVDNHDVLYLSHEQAGKLIIALYTSEMNYEYVSGRPTVAHKWDALKAIIDNLITFQGIDYEQYIGLIKSLIQDRNLDIYSITDIVLCCSLGEEWINFLNISSANNKHIIEGNDMKEIQYMYFKRTKIWIKELLEKDKEIDINDITNYCFNIIKLIYKYDIEDTNKLFENIDSHYGLYIINILLFIIGINRVENGNNNDIITYWPKGIEINNFKNRIESIMNSGEIILSDYNRGVVDSFITGQIIFDVEIGMNDDV